jgi:anaerobic selenocysteine-containing dehydrogenase
LLLDEARRSVRLDVIATRCGPSHGSAGTLDIDTMATQEECIREAPMIETVPSICRYCPAHCPILVTVEDGRVSKVVGDPENEFFAAYTCPKGRALPEQHNHPDRLLSSVSRHEDGVHRPISSRQAMDEIAERIGQIVAEHGPRSVALYVGTNSLPYAAAPGLAHSWLSALGSRMFFTSNTIDQPGKQIAAALHGGWQGGEHGFEGADTWLLVGLNPVISKSTGVPSQNPARKLKDAVDSGMALIVIDPRRTETARRARIHLQPRPGEDPTLMAGLLHVIIHEELHDADFVRDNAEGLEALCEAVKGFTPDYVSTRAGVPKEQLVEAARLFARARRGCSTTGTGSSFSTRGTLTEYLSLCLNTICGRWARAGDQVLRPNVLLPAYAARAQPYPPYQAWGYGEKLRVRGLTNATCGLPTAALADEMLLRGDGQVKALICLGGNPMMAWPDQRRTEKALQGLDLLVTLDIEMSATAQLADYVIAPPLTLETPGMTQPIEALKYFSIGIGYGRPHAQYSPRIVEPPEGSDLVEEWAFFYGLAQRMGLSLNLIGFFGWGRHIESPPLVVELDMVEPPTTESLYEALTQTSRISLEEVKRHPHGHVFTEINERVLPREEGNDTRLRLDDGNMMRELADVGREDFESLQSIDRHAFRLIPRRSNNFLNSSGRSIQKLTGKRPYNPVFMHPGDLAGLALRSGESVEVRSDHDWILGVVEADDTLRPGVVAMTHGFGGAPGQDARHREIGSNTGRLVRADED